MVGIWLSPDVRGQGVGTLAQRLSVDLLFRHQVATNRVEAHTDVENVAEQRALSKAGFTSRRSSSGRPMEGRRVSQQPAVQHLARRMEQAAKQAVKQAVKVDAVEFRFNV